MVEQWQLVGTAQHGDHHESHSTHRADLGAVAKQRKGDQGVLIAVPLPREEHSDEDATDDEQEDDAPVYLSVLFGIRVWEDILPQA